MVDDKKRRCPRCDRVILPEIVRAGNLSPITIAAVICPSCGGPTDDRPNHHWGCLLVAAIGIGLGWWFWPAGYVALRAAMLVPVAGPKTALPVAHIEIPPIPDNAAASCAVESSEGSPIIAEQIAEPVDDMAVREKAASDKLRQAKTLLEQVVEDYPGTEAAEEAAALLTD